MDAARDRYVYALYAAGCPTPHYIGVGKDYRLNKSAKKHGGIPRKLAWNVTIDEANAIEVALIAHYGRRDIGTGCLANANAGGGGSKDIAPSTRAKLSASLKLAFSDPIVRAKISDGLREALATPEARATRSLVSKGLWERPGFRSKQSERTRKQMDAEARANLAALAKLRGVSLQTRSACLAANIGRRQTDDERRTRSEALKGRPRPPDVVARIAAANRGKKMSAEACAKMSASAKLRCASPNGRARILEMTRLRLSSGAAEPC